MGHLFLTKGRMNYRLTGPRYGELTLFNPISVAGQACYPRPIWWELNAFVCRFKPKDSDFVAQLTELGV